MTEPPNRALVVEGVGYDHRHRARNRILLDDRDTERVQELAALLTHDPRDEPMFWMTSPVVTVVLLRYREPVLERGLLSGGDWVRTDTGDYQMPDPRRLTELLPAAVTELIAGPA